MHDLSTLTLVLAQTAPAATSGDTQHSNPLAGIMSSELVFPILLFIMLYFVLIRPQTKAKKDHEKLLSSLKSGDRVTMSSGILGTVTNIKDKDIVVVKIADNVKIEVLKSSITVISKEESKEESK